MLGALVIGVLGYGVSITLWIQGARKVGAARFRSGAGPSRRPWTRSRRLRREVRAFRRAEEDVRPEQPPAPQRQHRARLNRRSRRGRCRTDKRGQPQPFLSLTGNVTPVRFNEFLLTLHILAAAAWIGAALGLQVIARRVVAAAPDAAVDQFGLDAEAVGKTVFAPSGVVLVTTGVALVVRTHLSWTTPWIALGVLAVLLAGTVGGAFLIPEGRRIAQMATRPGHDTTEIRARTRRRFLVARIDLLVLILGLADMVFKPVW